MKKGSMEWYKAKHRETLRMEAELSYRDKIKVYLNLPLHELKEANPVLYQVVKEKYRTLDDNATLDEARMIKLFEKVFVESSMKALEMLYKLDGSMSDLTNDPDWEEVEAATEGIK